MMVWWVHCEMRWGSPMGTPSYDHDIPNGRHHVIPLMHHLSFDHRASIVLWMHWVGIS